MAVNVFWHRLNIDPIVINSQFCAAKRTSIKNYQNFGAIMSFSSSQCRICYTTTIHPTGRLLDNGGAAMTGQHIMTFRLFDNATGNNMLWDEVQTVFFVNGYYSVVLGQTIRATH